MPPIAWLIVGSGLLSMWLYKKSKGPAWQGFSKEIFGEDSDEFEDY